jgi:hypothetical protein
VLESDSSERAGLLSSLKQDVRSKEDAVVTLKQSLKEADITNKQLQASIGSVWFLLFGCRRLLSLLAENLQQDGARAINEFEREKELLLKEHTMEVWSSLSRALYR